VFYRTFITGKRKDRAQGLVEFALALPILILIFFGLIDLGRFLFVYAAITSASREAARYGSAGGNTPDGVPRYMDCTGMVDAAMRIGNFAGVQSSDISIQYDRGPGTSVFSNCPTSFPEDIIGGVDRVIVQVSTTFTPMALFFGIDPIDIDSSSARTVIKNIQVAGLTATYGPTSVSLSANISLSAPEIPDMLSVTETPTYTPTSTNVSASTPTATLPFTFTPSNTPIPPEAPIIHDINWIENQNKCEDLQFLWDTNDSWLEYPGIAPIQYQLYRDGYLVALIYPDSQFVWNTGDDLNHNSSITLSCQAIFPGMLASEMVSITLECDKGELVER
jgi:Flp pilus assembly protein TadG